MWKNDLNLGVKTEQKRSKIDAENCSQFDSNLERPKAPQKWVRNRGGGPGEVAPLGFFMTGSACKRWTLCGRSGGTKDQGRGSGGGKGLGVAADQEAGGFFLRVFFALFCDVFQLSGG